jgi:hypothetical protein
MARILMVLPFRLSPRLRLITGFLSPLCLHCLSIRCSGGGGYMSPASGVAIGIQARGMGCREGDAFFFHSLPMFLIKSRLERGVQRPVRRNWGLVDGFEGWNCGLCPSLLMLLRERCCTIAALACSATAGMACDHCINQTIPACW